MTFTKQCQLCGNIHSFMTINNKLLCAFCGTGDGIKEVILDNEWEK